MSTLLQLPVLRLEQRIKQELELNPLLEIDTELEETMEQTEKEEKDSEEETEDDEEEIKEEIKEEEEVDWETIINDEDNYEIKRPREHREDDIIRPEPSPVTLMDHLFEQLHLEPITDEEMKIGEYILWCLDDDGYLSCDTDVIAENFSTTPDSVEKVLNVIQKFDPVGIGARNLRECLLIQLNESAEKDEIAINMIEECFEDFSNKRFEKISKKMEISLSEIKRIMEVVTRLNPKPGERYVSASEHYIVPDIILNNVDGNFTISLNDWNIPRLRINESYKQLLRDKKKINKETRDYIRQRLESARWLINSIYQRISFNVASNARIPLLVKRNPPFSLPSFHWSGISCEKTVR